MSTDTNHHGIRFWGNGQQQHIDNTPITTTLLNYLRETLQLTGTKEGCSEGDCGDALSGNLCRCTGYRPIIDAAEHMYDLGEQLTTEAQQALNAPSQTSTLITQQSAPLPNKVFGYSNHNDNPKQQQCFIPTTLEALAAQVTQYPDACILAGGTDIGLWITKQQGAGWLTSEELYWNANGRLQTHVPSTYKIPVAGDIPAHFNVRLVDKKPNREASIYRSKHE